MRAMSLARSVALPTLLLAAILGAAMSDTVAGFIVRGMVTRVIPHWLGF